MAVRFKCVFLVVSMAGFGWGCSDDSTGDEADAAMDAALPDAGEVDAGDAEIDARPTEPGPEFDRFCGAQTWDSSLVPATVHELNGTYLGVYSTVPVGSLETMKVIPQHPFQVTTIRVAYAGNSGPIRVRLMRNLGRSYPDLDSPDGDLLPPIETDVQDPDRDVWIELDVSDYYVFLMPTEHYILVNERLDGSPYLVLEDLPTGERSQALLHIPGEYYPYGSDGNFRMQLVGDYFCAWDEASRWFGDTTGHPFADVRSQRVSVTDLNGDSHDDLVLISGGPLAYFGNGQGGFTDPGFDLFPDVPRAHMLVFGDVDNDGDVDAFAATYVGADNDNDSVTLQDGDCDDSNDTVSPFHAESMGNFRDDNCDRIADDGTDTSDNDGDGYAIADGDCDDTRDDVTPDATELLDGVDNNCDGQADEDYVNRILLNDGAGNFAALPNSGVETLDHSTAAGFGDANGDGALDLYWGNWLLHYPDHPAMEDRYFTGNGDGTFVDAHAAAGLEPIQPYSCYGVMWNDYNNDGLQDIFVGNYHLYANQLWQNQGNGTFVDVAVATGVAYDDIANPLPILPGGHTYGGDFGDIDNDGDMDFYMCNLAHPRDHPWADPSMFLINQGPPDYEFVNVFSDFGFIYDEGDINAAFADFDHDMDLDIAIGAVYPTHHNRFYRNDGAAGFTDITYETNTAVERGVTVVWSDVDEDGDLDLIIASVDGPPSVHVFINRVGQDNNWIQLVLQGTATNRSAAGARVTLTAGGVTQMRDVRGGGGHNNAQNTRVVHFGLAQETIIDSVTVRWVGGSTETINGLSPNARFLVVEGSGQGVQQ